MSELKKWRWAEEEVAVVNDFLDWCEQQRIELAVPRTEGRWSLVPIDCTRTTLLYRYLGIDPTKLENERREILASVQRGPELKTLDDR